jgi:hypothetical protein
MYNLERINSILVGYLNRSKIPDHAVTVPVAFAYGPDDKIDRESWINSLCVGDLVGFYAELPEEDFGRWRSSKTRGVGIVSDVTKNWLHIQWIDWDHKTGGMRVKRSASSDTSMCRMRLPDEPDIAYNLFVSPYDGVGMDRMLRVLRHAQGVHVGAKVYDSVVCVSIEREEHLRYIGSRGVIDPSKIKIYGGSEYDKACEQEHVRERALDLYNRP